MKTNFNFLMPIVFVAAGLAVVGCLKLTTAEEVGSTPISPGNVPPATEKSRPAGKYTIREIMQNGFKAEGNLKKQMLDGKATTEQKAQFIDYVENLAQYKIRKGNAASWKEKTTALIVAAKGTDLPALKKATNCKACHSVHKNYPPKKK